MSKEEAIREAEAFIRKALSRTSPTKVSEKSIKAAAAKVAKIVPKKKADQKAA